jgi:NitT/TauT family transport system ATP-binding protein
MVSTLSPLLLQAKSVCQAFPKPGGGELVVLQDVDLILRESEIVSLLGRSGSGKSTLLRIVSGLIRPTSGGVLVNGQPVTGAVRGVAMVFQSFALFPWLTVLENVEFGLEALGVPEVQMRRRALAAIDLIGLGGYESAYPKGISGGMRQRVGFARAIVVHPNILLMDEPFSALDVLTAETLRTDFLDLWAEGKMPIKSVLMVTHNIEEAVLMSDRILVFASNPGRVASEIRVDLPHPRRRLDPTFRNLVDKIYGVMTQRAVGQTREALGGHISGAGLSMIMPRVSINQLAGFMEALAAPPYLGKADLPAIATLLQMDVDELFPIAEVLQLLHFADLAEGDIRLTDIGQKFVDADVDARKRLFAECCLAHVPLVAHIRYVLDERPSHRASFNRFLEELEDSMTEVLARQNLRAAIGWGRYSEIFSYDDDGETFSLENPS